MGTLSGMTGFARASTGTAGGELSAEARSVNGRGLDIRLRLPDGMAHLEAEARARIKAAFEPRFGVRDGCRWTRFQALKAPSMSIRHVYALWRWPGAILSMKDWQPPLELMAFWHCAASSSVRMRRPAMQRQLKKQIQPCWLFSMR